jgi:hypothetical protein
VKARADAVLEAVGDVHRAREGVSGRAAALASIVGRNRPGLITESKLSKLARDADALLLAGGEIPPIPRHEPVVEAVQS